jgi:FMN reductase
MTRHEIAVVSAGLRSPSSTRRLADDLAAAARRALECSGGTVEIAHVELRLLAHDLPEALLTGRPGPRLREALDAVTAADAVVAVTPTFAGSYSGLFKMFVDALDRDALRGMPVLLAATGGSSRHSLMIDHTMRPLFATLGAVAVPTAVYAVSSDFGDSAAVLARRTDRAARELARAVVALAGVRRSLRLVPQGATPAGWR